MNDKRKPADSNITGGSPMAHLIENMDSILFYIVSFCTISLEFFGVVVLVVTSIKCFIRWIRGDPRVRLDLAQGTALALNFKMGSEVLRTVVVREWSELGILGVVIILRGMMTAMIHMEVKNEKKSLNESHHDDPNKDPHDSNPHDSEAPSSDNSRFEHSSHMIWADKYRKRN